MSVAFSSMNVATVGASPAALTTKFSPSPFTNYTFHELSLDQIAFNLRGDITWFDNIANEIADEIYNITEVWNSDESEAARRVHIDRWLTILVQSKVNSPLIVPEYQIKPSLLLPGHGRLDYIIARYEAGNIISFPSLVVEAKRNLGFAKYDGVGQLVAAMDTFIREQSPNESAFLGGIVTDGRHWRFVNVVRILNRTNGTIRDAYVNMSPLIDIGNPIKDWEKNGSDITTTNNAINVWSLLSHFVINYRTNDRNIL